MSHLCPTFDAADDDNARRRQRPGLYAVSVDVTVFATTVEEAEDAVRRCLPDGTDLTFAIGPRVTVSTVRDDHTTFVD